MLTLVLLALGALHLMPAVAGFSPSRLSALYGVEPGDAVMMTLLQHRAALLGLVGLVMVIATFVPDHRGLALLVCGLSMTSFLVIAAARNTTAGPLKSIVAADVIGVGLLILAVILQWQLGRAV